MLYQNDFEQVQTELLRVEDWVDNIADILAEAELEGGSLSVKNAYNSFSTAVKVLEEKEVRCKQLEEQASWRTFLKEQLANREITSKENGLF